MSKLNKKVETEQTVVEPDGSEVQKNNHRHCAFLCHGWRRCYKFLLLGLVLLLIVTIPSLLMTQGKGKSSNKDKDENSDEDPASPAPPPTDTMPPPPVDDESPPSWNLLGKIVGDNGWGNGGFSVSLSSDGTIVAMSTPYGKNATGGLARVYKHNDNSEWDQLGDDIIGNFIGSADSISLSSDGTVIAVGSSDYDYGKDPVRVLEYSKANGWKQKGGDIKTASVESPVSLSSDGNIVAVGAGSHIEVYKYMSGNGWTQLGEGIESYGWPASLSPDGSTVATNRGYNPSLTHVHKYDEQNGWQLQGDAIPATSSRSVSLSLDGSIVAIGDSRAYQVRVYEFREGSGWIQKGEDIMEDDAKYHFGWSVSLSLDGSVVAVGDIWGGDNERNGRVRVYGFDESSGWTQRGDVIDGELAGDANGYSVSLSADGTIVAIGMPQNEYNSETRIGAVRIFKFE